MSEVKIISAYEDVRKRAESVGLTVKIGSRDRFAIGDVPKADGLVCFDTIADLDNFVRGYEFGYKSGLDVS
jgi:hypothetical protein